ncbi:MAG TPA: C39 family peptidase, partial [Anaerolineae bacterium]|nr:C39 family peptidase [Anaerolineae bacterium]
MSTRLRATVKKAGFLFVLVLLLVPSASTLLVGADDPEGSYFHIRTAILGDGRAITESVISGPPDPPPGYPRPPARLPDRDASAGINVLSDVPAYNWSFGCSATSAAMIAGYYDRTGYADMYTGPTNGGVGPLDNSSWPDWQDSSGAWRHQCPLSATHMGLDGRTIRGHVDDYWVEYGDPGPDPFIGNWPEHTYGDCAGDYMKTNQSSHGNADGSTTIYTLYNGSALHWDDMETYGIADEDGGYGLKLFYESRGYTVTEMYNQCVLGYAHPARGFTYEQYKAEIDAGRPVMIHLEGHTMVGVGYDDSGDLMYVHDTWDYAVHTMTWGGTYVGMRHYAVTIAQLAPLTVPLVAPSDLAAAAVGADQIDLTWTDNSADETAFHVERSPNGTTAWAEVATVPAGATSYSDAAL